MQKAPTSRQDYTVAPPLSANPAPRRSRLSNILLIGISLGLLAWSGHLLQRRLTSVSSIDAVINGTLIDVKAPQSGTISALHTDTGTLTTRNHVLLSIQNDQISKLTVQSIQTRLNQQQAQLAQAQVQLAQQQALLQQVATDQQRQSQLETVVAQESVEQTQADLVGAQARYRLAQLNHQRMSELRSQGAVPQANLDTATLEMAQRQAEVTSLNARITTSQAAQQAAQQGLTLDKTRSNYDPRIRLQELQQQVTNQRQYVATLTQGIKDIQAELTQATADWQRQRQRLVITPVSGVMWRLATQPGKYVESGESLGQILDCSRRWVDVFVDEKAVRSLPPGTPAQIEFYGETAPTLQGQVSLVRSGIGRLAAGEDVAVTVSQHLPRTSQVRVELDPNADRGTPEQFCYVGYTAKVTFKVQ